jgi:8-oxo-dGTP pyrophosphatase MutT (NUDIX family)
LESRIRIQVLALVRRGDQILVERGHDSVKVETFYRLLGGTVEPGEAETDALHREIREELGTDIEVGPRIADIDNRFTYEGEDWHDLCLVYECTLLDSRLYQIDEWNADEPGVCTHHVSWQRVDSLGPDGSILYPEQLIDLL